MAERNAKGSADLRVNNSQTRCFCYIRRKTQTYFRLVACAIVGCKTY